MTHPQRASQNRQPPVCSDILGHINDGHINDVRIALTARLRAVSDTSPRISDNWPNVATSRAAGTRAASSHQRNRLDSPRSRLRCGFSSGLVWLLLFSISAGNAVRGDDFSRESHFFKQLSTPMTSVLDGKPFRSGLERIATHTGLNLWLDRLVDPSVLIEVGPLGPTAFAAIEKLAASKDCVVMPVSGVVLVGRENWVQQTAAAILAISVARRGGSIDLSWNDLTTPEEALQAVTKGASGSVRGQPTLPHDLWPAVTWHNIDRQVAIALIFAQFDSLAEDQASPVDLSQTFTRRYSQGVVTLPQLRQAMRASDPASQVRVSGDWIVAKGTIAAHRTATITMLHMTGDATGVDPDADTFNLKKMTTSAENALQQLAQTAGKTCIIEPAAAEACKTIISIEGSDVTIRQLIDMAAEQAGVLATWKNDSIEVTLAR